MTSGEPGRKVGKWQRRALVAVMPAGFTMLTLWILWVVIGSTSGWITGIGWLQAVLGLVTSVLLIMVGTAYRKVLGE
jgi:hypothetical protein